MKKKHKHLNLKVDPGIDTRHRRTGKPLPDPKDTKFYATAQGDISNTDTYSGMCNHMRIVNKDRETTEFRSLFSLPAGVQSPVATGLKNPESFVVERAMMRGVEDTLPKAIKTGFFAVGAGHKHT